MSRLAPDRVIGRDASGRVTLDLMYLLSEYRPGSMRNWLVEQRHLVEVHQAELEKLETSILARGLVNPVRLSPHGERPRHVIDGHHRLLICAWHEWEAVPVTWGYDWIDTDA